MYSIDKRKQNFINKASTLHKNTYSYDHIVFKNCHTPIQLTCNAHGDFTITPMHHLRGHGCKLCGIEKSKRKTGAYSKYTQEQIIQLCKKTHGNTYDYSKVKFVNTLQKIEIVCKQHGSFFQLFRDHAFRKHRCPKCFPSIKTKSFLTKEIIEAFDDCYQTINIKSKNIFRLCKIHGEFKTTKSNLYKKSGCPKCVGRTSELQKEITSYIKTLTKHEVHENYIFKNKKELDIYIPALRIAIEINGAFPHSTGSWYYQRFPITERDSLARQKETFKYKELHKQNIRLITLFDKDYENNSEKVKYFLKAIFAPQTLQKIYARKTCIKDITFKEAEDFLQKYHFQNSARCSKYLGLYYKDNLVSVMCFSKKRNRYIEDWELTRYASKAFVIGGAKKLLAHFIRTTSFKQLVSFCDNRLFTGNMYYDLGFKKVKHYNFNYYFLYKNKLYHKQKFTKNNISKLFGTNCVKDSYFDTTESLNIYKVYCPGITKFVLTP